MMSITCLLLSFALYGYVIADCNITTKAEWNGLKRKHVEYLPRPVGLVIIQHTVTPTCKTNKACADIVRNIQTDHMLNNGFWDIGQSFLIGGNGKVYEGSGWLHVGAHTYGYNRRSIGISFIGNFNENQPTTKALKAAQDLLQCGVDKGHLKANYDLIGHRQVLATESPGKKLFIEIREWPHFLQDTSKIEE